MDRIAATIRSSRWLDDNANLEEHCREISFQVDSLIANSTAAQPRMLVSLSLLMVYTAEVLWPAVASPTRLMQIRSDLTAIDKMLKKEITETRNQAHLRDLALFFSVLIKSIEHYRSTHLQSNKPNRPGLHRSVSGKLCFAYF